MKQVFPLFLGVTIAVSACGNKTSSLPQGQVVATVDGRDITASELNSELGMLGSVSGPNDSRQRQALQQLIVRRLLVAEASKLGVDKSPQTAILTGQAEQVAIVAALATKFSKDVPKVSNDEADEYVRANPAAFARRKLLFTDQLVIGIAPANLERQLQPLHTLHTLSEAEAMLKAKSIPYRHVGAVIDTATIDPRQAEQISAIGPNDVFLSRSGKSVQVTSVIATRIVPLEGADATIVARNLLTQQRTAGQVQQRLAQIIKHAKGRVIINPSYTGKVPADFK